MPSQDSHIVSVENEFATYSLKQDGLLYFIYKPSVYIDYYAAQKVVADRVRFQQGIDYYVVCDTSGISGTTHAAREYFESLGSEQVLAVGFVVSSTVARTVLSLYLKDHRPPVKLDVFESQKSAAFYLKGFLKVN